MQLFQPFVAVLTFAIPVVSSLSQYVSFFLPALIEQRLVLNHQRTVDWYHLKKKTTFTCKTNQSK